MKFNFFGFFLFSSLFFLFNLFLKSSLPILFFLLFKTLLYASSLIFKFSAKLILVKSIDSSLLLVSLLISLFSSLFSFYKGLGHLSFRHSLSFSVASFVSLFMILLVSWKLASRLPPLFLLFWLIILFILFRDNW